MWVKSPRGFQGQPMNVMLARARGRSTGARLNLIGRSWPRRRPLHFVVCVFCCLLFPGAKCAPGPICNIHPICHLIPSCPFLLWPTMCGSCALYVCLFVPPFYSSIDWTIPMLPLPRRFNNPPPQLSSSHKMGLILTRTRLFFRYHIPKSTLRSPLPGKHVPQGQHPRPRGFRLRSRARHGG